MQSTEELQADWQRMAARVIFGLCSIQNAWYLVMETEADGLSM